MLKMIKTDMQLQSVYSINTNFNSRTRLPEYGHVDGGITPATIRLLGGKGNLQLTQPWLDYINLINNNNPIIMKYLFHADSGWQNSDEYGRVEELSFEGNVIDVNISGDKAYINTFHLNETPPKTVDYNDPRLNLFTIVTREDTLIGSPKGRAYIILIAREGEDLYIPTEYLNDVTPPITKKVKETITIYNDYSSKVLPITGS